MRRGIIRALIPMQQPCASCLALLVATTLGVPAHAQEWPQWRGPGRDGAIESFATPAEWPGELQHQWRVEVGLGYATPLLVGARLYVFARQDGEEVMQALDAATGRVVWRTGYPAPFTMSPATARHGQGPKSTPAYAGGRLFSLGMSGIVTAFDAETGRQLWQSPPTSAQPAFHTATSPIVDGNLVIVHVGGPGQAALTAFDAASGLVRWTWENDSPAYGSPLIVDLNGERQLVTFTHRHMIGVSTTTGNLLWQRPFTTPSDTTAQTPILHGGMIIQAGRERGITAFRVTRQGGTWGTEDVWHTDEVSLHLANGVVVDGVLYGLSHLNRGQYFALDLDAGRVLWTSEPRQAENAAMVRAGQTVFALEEDAELLVLEASRTSFMPVRRYTVAAEETWTQPTISGSRFYIKDEAHLTLWTLD
jgi:outer membrane protein assembly factor BamB